MLYARTKALLYVKHKTDRESTENAGSENTGSTPRYDGNVSLENAGLNSLA